MKVADLGELGVLEVILKRIGSGSDRALIGIGDDTAAWLVADQIVLAKLGSQIEHIHFRREFMTWQDVGWKSLAINLSDFAAMGGRPEYVLVGLALPADFEIGAIDDFYAGVAEAADRYGVTIAGGDTVGSGQFTVSIALFGTGPTVDPAVPEQGLNRLLRRSAARPGDELAVTGSLGGAAAGLVAMLEGLDLPPDLFTVLRRRFARPIPRLAEGEILVSAGVRSGMDISDGLLIDSGRLARASGLAAEIIAEAVPVDPAAGAALPERALELALTGGEDYELLVAASPDTLEAARQQLEVPLTTVGRLHAGEPGRIIVRDAAGRDVTPTHLGWEHLRA